MGVNLKLSQASVMLLVFALNIGTSAYAEPTIAIVTEHWPPFNFLNEHGEVDGVSTKLVREMMDEAGYSYQIDLVSWQRAYALARDNKNTLIYTIFKLENRIEDFQWICPFLTTGASQLFALEHRQDIEIKSVGDLKQYSIGVLNRGASYEHLVFLGLTPEVQLDTTASELANIRKLFAGRVDLIVQEADLIESRLKSVGKGIDEVRAVYTLEPNNGTTACLAMSLDTPKSIVQRLRSALDVVHARKARSDTLE